MNCWRACDLPRIVARSSWRLDRETTRRSSLWRAFDFTGFSRLPALTARGARNHASGPGELDPPDGTQAAIVKLRLAILRAERSLAGRCDHPDRPPSSCYGVAHAPYRNRLCVDFSAAGERRRRGRDEARAAYNALRWNVAMAPRRERALGLTLHPWFGLDERVVWRLPCIQPVYIER
jgi:hypothetical protein